MELEMKSKKTKKALFPDELINKMGGIPLPLSDDQLAGLRYAITTLSDKEQRILKMHYEEGQVFQSIADDYGVSSNRIQQIVDRAIEKLRHPNRISYVIDGFETASKLPEGIAKSRRTSEYSVATLGLSAKVTNALLGQGIDTVGKLCYALENDPDRLRNLPGFKYEMAAEILRVLRKLGIKYIGHSMHDAASYVWIGRKVQVKA